MIRRHLRRVLLGADFDRVEILARHRLDDLRTARKTCRALREQLAAMTDRATDAEADHGVVVDEVRHLKASALQAEQTLGRLRAGDASAWCDVGFVPAARLAERQVALESARDGWAMALERGTALDSLLDRLGIEPSATFDERVGALEGHVVSLRMLEAMPDRWPSSGWSYAQWARYADGLEERLAALRVEVDGLKLPA